MGVDEVFWENVKQRLRKSRVGLPMKWGWERKGLLERHHRNDKRGRGEPREDGAVNTKGAWTIWEDTGNIMDFKA